MKKLTRIVAGLASAGLLGLTPLALSAPANAAETLATTINFEFYKTSLVHGESTHASGAVLDSNGSSVYGGTATLYEMSSKSSTWTAIAVDDAPGYLYFENVKPKSNSAYKVVYSGFTSTSAYSNSYLASESGVAGISVGRKITAPKKGFVLKGKVTPDYKKKKIVIKVSKKQDKGYKKFRTVKTNKKGKYRVVLPKRRGTWYYQIRTKADKHYAANGYGWRTWVY